MRNVCGTYCVLLLLFLLLSVNGDILPNDIQSMATVPPSSNSSIVNGQLILINKSAHQAGAVWFTQKQNLKYGFNATFQFSTPDACTTGDCALEGFAIVFQNDNTTVVGSSGDMLGYDIENSFAVEIDYNDNSMIDSPYPASPSHSGLLYRSQYSVKNSPQHSLSGYRNLNTIDISYTMVEVYYDTTWLSVWFTSPTTGAYTQYQTTFNPSYAINSSDVWVGFTAGTSNKPASITITSFEFRELSYIVALYPPTGPSSGVVQLQLYTIRSLSQPTYCIFGATTVVLATVLSVNHTDNSGTISCTCPNITGTHAVSVTHTGQPDAYPISSKSYVGQPGQPSYNLDVAVVISNVTSSSFDVNCASGNNHPLNTYFNITFKNNTNIINFRTFESRMLFTGLDPWQSYTVTVHACVDTATCGSPIQAQTITLPECGNGIVEGDEECDSGFLCSTDTCTCLSQSLPDGVNGCVIVVCPETAAGECNSQGNCVSGQCICNNAYTGPACDYVSLPLLFDVSDSSVTISTPAEVTDSSMTYILYLNNITEVYHYNNTLVYEEHTFNFTLVYENYTDVLNTWIYNATLRNGALVSITYYLFLNETTIDVFGTNVTGSANTVKLNIAVEKWPFKYFNNRLIISIKTDHTAAKSSTACVRYDTETYGKENAALYQEVSNSDGYILYVQFSQIAVIDGVRKNINFVVDNGDESFVEIMVPYFGDNAQIDPSYSILLDGSLDKKAFSCLNHGWSLLQIIIVVAVLVGICIIFVVFVVLWKMHRVAAGRRAILLKEEDTML